MRILSSNSIKGVVLSGSTVVLYGNHAVNAALENPERKHVALYVLEQDKDKYKNFSKILKVVAKKEFEKITHEGAVHQNIALKTSGLPNLDVEDLVSAGEESLLLAFDQVTDPHNVGAILRSAACFKVDGALHTHKNAPSETGVLAKSACGGLEHVPFARVTNLVRALNQLKEQGYWVVGLSEHSKQCLDELDLPKKLVFVVGAEGEGMRRLVMETCDFLGKLRTNPNFPTLNASNAAAVALYEIRR